MGKKKDDGFFSDLEDSKKAANDDFFGELGAPPKKEIRNDKNDDFFGDLGAPPKKVESARDEAWNQLKNTSKTEYFFAFIWLELIAGAIVYFFFRDYFNVFLFVGGIIFIIASLARKIYIGILVGLVLIAANYPNLVWQYYNEGLKTAQNLQIEDGINAIKDYYHSFFPEEKTKTASSKTASSEEPVNDQSSATSDNVQENTTATESQPTKRFDYEYKTFTDRIDGFTFIYPAMIPDIQQSEKSNYEIYVKEMDMYIYIESYVGGIKDLRDHYRIEHLPGGQGKIVKENLFDNGYEMEFDAGSNYIKYKRFYGPKTHQGIKINFPSKYLNDPDYQEAVSKIMNGYIPAENIP